MEEENLREAEKVIEKIELTIKPPTKNCFKFLC
jgi:hypothetical protein